LELESLPESIIVLGGGYVGCEFADLLNTIGVKVTLVQGSGQLLAREDSDIAAAIEQNFVDAGITVRLGARAQRIARDADGAGQPRSTTGRLIPYSVFTTPELGRVGLSERQARDAGYNVRIAKMPVTAIPRARAMGHLEGFWKAVIHRETNQILGAAMLGTEAGEAIAVVQMAMLAGMDYTVVRDAIITRPTTAESLTLLFTPTYLED
jgi:pyruvate/2-oxoglutarate dehydrogenase complex dihydrolipoamide dehydrogenase (E3) component